MRVAILSFLFCLLPLQSFAMDHRPPPMNKVSVHLQAEEWATTTSALVTVNVNAVMQQSDLGQSQKTVMSKLRMISDQATWHITSFSRHKDSSGLERVDIQAEARLPDTELPKLRDRAERVSKAGEKFRVINIQFKPALKDFERTRQNLREKLYSEAREELTRLNKVYGEQKFFLHNISFDGAAPPQPVPFQMKAMMRSADAGMREQVAPLTVGDKVIMNAVVTFASKIDKAV